MSVLLEKLAKEGSVPLERYGHQVGGHHMLFKYEDTLCKPVISREHFFYQTVPKVVKRYTPAYHGVINVSYMEQSSGEIRVVASPREQLVPVPPSREVENGSAESANEVSKGWVRGNFPKCTTGNTIHSNGRSITSRDVVNGESYYNPWATMCSHNMDERLRELGGDLDSFTKDYMILENLTIKYRSPCVLDLKVGTRQHGDDATAEKVQKHIYTCSISTSCTLGVRMAGMQKYNALKNEYIFYDKYFGKQLTIEEFRQVVQVFFDNGICFRSDVLPPLVRMLEDLRTSIKSLPTYRYFSSSLLVLYDGAECPQGLGHLEEALVGEEKLEGIIERAKKAEADKTEMDYSLENASMAARPEVHNTMRNSAESAPTMMSDAELAQARQVVDLRMIDFAHATHDGYKDHIHYEGVDESYLVGLDSLIQMFTDMKRTHCDKGRVA